MRKDRPVPPATHNHTPRQNTDCHDVSVEEHVVEARLQVREVEHVVCPRRAQLEGERGRRFEVDGRHLIDGIWNDPCLMISAKAPAEHNNQDTSSFC